MDKSEPVNIRHGGQDDRLPNVKCKMKNGKMEKVRYVELIHEVRREFFLIKRKF